MARMPRVGSLAGIVGAGAAVLVLVVVLSAVHLLPQLRNPFAETTTVRSEPVILKSITELSDIAFIDFSQLKNQAIMKLLDGKIGHYASCLSEAAPLTTEL